VKQVTLGGREVWALNATDARVLYEQIFERETYGGHGIVLREGELVIDAGANIGLASMWFAGRGARIVAVEPNPEVFACLQRNAPHATLHACALGDQPGFAELTYDRFVSSTGTLGEPKALDAGALAKDLGVPRVVAAGLEAVRRLARRTARVEVKTLSQVMAGVERVDLLKLDVEGAEARALAGIAAEDWAKIRQVIVETDDVDGISATLRAHGFTLELDREPGETYRALGLHNVYARRVTS
jgi:FkbM family methyltransferase